jgi:hypothetical protein
MKEVLSGTFESGKVKFVKTNVNTDFFKSLRKKIKKRFGRSK